MSSIFSYVIQILENMNKNGKHNHITTHSPLAQAPPTPSDACVCVRVGRGMPDMELSTILFHSRPLLLSMGVKGLSFRDPPGPRDTPLGPSQLITKLGKRSKFPKLWKTVHTSISFDSFSLAGDSNSRGG